MVEVFLSPGFLNMSCVLVEEQAEVKTILKSSGEFYKKRREQGIPTKPQVVVVERKDIKEVNPNQKDKE